MHIPSSCGANGFSTFGDHHHNSHFPQKKDLIMHLQDNTHLTVPIQEHKDFSVFKAFRDRVRNINSQSQRVIHHSKVY